MEEDNERLSSALDEERLRSAATRRLAAGVASSDSHSLHASADPPAAGPLAELHAVMISTPRSHWPAWLLQCLAQEEGSHGLHGVSSSGHAGLRSAGGSRAQQRLSGAGGSGTGKWEGDDAAANEEEEEEAGGRAQAAEAALARAEEELEDVKARWVVHMVYKQQMSV